MKTEFSYDDVAYPSYTFLQTGPDRLATLAALHGIAAAEPRCCRVLEIGCGDGTNLMSHAYLLPNSEFVGIDLSAGHIKDANAAAKAIELRNIAFRQMNLMAFDVQAFGMFDYIVAHGLFSWVPVEVREKVLEIYSAALRPNGIGYISYNAFPGCHVRRIVSDMMKYHADGESDPTTMVGKGRTMIGFVAESLPADSRYKKIFEHEIESLYERNDENVLHDDFSDLNQPFYLHEFVAGLRPHGLAYVADADPGFLGDGSWSREIAETVGTLAPDIVSWEQYMDFIEMTRFRSSLICRAEAAPDRSAAESAIDHLRAASQIAASSPSPVFDDESVVVFKGPHNGTFELNHPLTKTALDVLQQAWPRSITMDELIAASIELVGSAVTEIDIKRTKTFLLHLYKNGFIKLHVHEYQFANAAGERPEVSRFARWQIERGCSALTTLAGVSISPDSDIVRQLLLLLDGTRDRRRLAADLPQRAKIPFSERETFDRDLSDKIEDNLTRMAEWGFLIR